MIRRRVLMGLVIAALLLAGCSLGEGNIDEDYSEMYKEAGISEHIESEEVKPLYPEHLSYELFSESGQSSFLVEADVITEGVSQPSVIEIAKSEITDEYILDLADKLFGSSYKIKKPYPICTEEELFTEEAYVKELFYAVPEEERSFSEPMYEIIQYLNGFNADRVSDMEEGQVIVHIENSRDFGKNSNGEVVELQYDLAMIEGTIGGKVYQLFYGKFEDSMALRLRPVYPVRHSETLCTMDSTIYEDLFGENMCDIEDGRVIAEDILDQIGYSDFEEHSVAKRKCTDNENNPYLDGYYYYYTREINGIENSVFDNTNAILYNDMVTGGSSYCGQEYICVKVNHDGLLGIEFGDYYTTKSVLSDRVELMSFEQVDAIAQEHLCEIMDKFESSSDYDTYSFLTRWYTPAESIDEVRFSYIPQFCDGKCVYIPVWVYLYNSCYYGDKTYFTNKYVVLAVNAIDGSVVHMNYVQPFALVSWGREPL